MGAEEKGLMDVWCRTWFERRWGEGGRRDIVGGSVDGGIFVGEAGVSFSGLMRKYLYIHIYIYLIHVHRKRGSSFIARCCYLFDSLNLLRSSVYFK